MLIAPPTQVHPACPLLLLPMLNGRPPCQSHAHCRVAPPWQTHAPPPMCMCIPQGDCTSRTSCVAPVRIERPLAMLIACTCHPSICCTHMPSPSMLATRSYVACPHRYAPPVARPAIRSILDSFCKLVINILFSICLILVLYVGFRAGFDSIAE